MDFLVESLSFLLILRDFGFTAGIGFTSEEGLHFTTAGIDSSTDVEGLSFTTAGFFLKGGDE